MAPKPQKKKKIRDTVNYSSLDFNPLILDQSTLDKLNDDYDPALVDHRRRLAKWEDKNAEREELAKALGVTDKVKLRSPIEILNEYKF